MVWCSGIRKNKLHFAAAGKTAAELIADRADFSKPNMGLTSWKGLKVRKGGKRHLELILAVFPMVFESEAIEADARAKGYTHEELSQEIEGTWEKLSKDLYQ